MIIITTNHPELHSPRPLPLLAGTGVSLHCTWPFDGRHSAPVTVFGSFRSVSRDCRRQR